MPTIEGAPDAHEILEQIREGVVTLDGGWRYVYANRRAAELLDAEPGTLLGQVIWELFPEVAAEPFGPAIRRSRAQGRSTHAEGYFHPLGRWFDIEAHPSNGGVTVVFRDADARHRTEADLEARARQQAAVATVSRAILAGLPLPEIYELACDAVAESLGVPLAKVLVLEGDALRLVAGRGWDDAELGRATVPTSRESQGGFTLVHGEPVAVTDFAFETRFSRPQLLSRHGVRSGVSVVIRADGAPFGVLGAHDRAPRQFSDDDTRFLASVGNVLGLAVERHRDRARLAESETLFRQLAEHIDAVLFMTSVGTDQVIYANPAYDRIFGRPRSELASTPGAWLEAVHPDDRQEVEAALAADRLHFDRTFRIVRPDGEVRWIHDRVFPVPDGERSVGRVVGVAEDVTEQRAAARAARHLTQERLARASAEAAVKARDEVLAYVSHELRSPLGSIGLTIDLLRRRGATELDTSLEILERSVGQMERLIRDLLDVARLEAGRLAVETLPADLAGLLEEVAADAGSRLGDRAVRVVVDLDPRLPRVLADPARLRQVLDNLVTNALKFTREGRITLKATPDREQVVVSVADTGVGLSAEDVPRLFDRFWQGRRGDRRGAGLGLAIVKGLIEAQGGEVWAESREGVGTTVSFSLPVAPESRSGAERR